MRHIFWVLSVFFLLTPALAGTYRDSSVPISSVESLDVSKYMGRWYEIARFPFRFEDGCYSVTADYALKPNGRIDVVNSCARGAINGPRDVARGEAQIVANGQLKVSFIPIPIIRDWFAGDYWILALREDYSLAVIGAPKGSTGWILARSPTISPDNLAYAQGVLTSNGYDITDLHYTEHGPSKP